MHQRGGIPGYSEIVVLWLRWEMSNLPEAEILRGVGQNSLPVLVYVGERRAFLFRLGCFSLASKSENDAIDFLRRNFFNPYITCRFTPVRAPMGGLL